MAIPDSILRNTGPLNQDQWVTMRQHTTIAYNMLYNIEYLRPALEVVYSHHEKWDGSGYPRGLKEEEIPLSARIFAVVDVWDALTTDRPYRLAWPLQEAREYIRQQSGKHFDPRVVEYFLKLV
jgi:response regulator RpfG family c-di-GMP phosphodiesterase